MKATILLAGFSSCDVIDATRELLADGSCVLQAPTLADGLVHLRGGVVDAVVLRLGPARLDVADLKRHAADRSIPVLEVAAPVNGGALRRLVADALRR